MSLKSGINLFIALLLVAFIGALLVCSEEVVYSKEIDDLCVIENTRRKHFNEPEIDCSKVDVVLNEELGILEIKEVDRTENKEIEEVKEEIFVWDGPILTQRSGVNYGPTGKETYYNLPMGRVIATMRNLGNTDEYWIREDGVKMLGKYVMIAANLNIFPRGSLVPTSLGMGIVCDTGGFANKNPMQVDIAVNWR